MRFIVGFFNRSLEILKNFKEELQSGKTLRSEVELAAEIQKHILSKTHVHLPSMDIVANSKSASEVGGDSYDIIERGDNYYVYL
jgi:serine phosphatase RsbU (regulator of sigma subunit)